MTQTRNAAGGVLSGRVRSHIDPLERRTLLASAGVLLSQDFNGSGVAWTQQNAVNTAGVTAAVSQAAAGTIDVQGGTAKTGAAVLAASAVPVNGFWSSALSSGKLAVSNSQTNLSLLTVGFNLSTTQIKPVTVTVTSYDAAGNATGSLEKDVTPAAANFLQRYSFELSSMLPAGGSFNAAAPFVSFAFAADSHNGWSGSPAVGLTVDNVNYAKPSYYVDGVNGKDTYSGKTEALAFKTPQAAAKVVEPGDIVLIKNGTYTKLGNSTGALTVTKGGTAANWVTFKNYPGQSPLFFNETYAAIKIGAFTNSPTTAPAVGWVEFRGMHVRGTADTLADDLKGTADPRANENGITVDGRAEANRPHDVRIADNFVELVSGGGIGAQEADRVQIENNVVRNTSWWTIYATSGISILSSFNFDGLTDTSDAHYTRIVSGNVVSGNQCFEKWGQIDDYSDGNGIILDINHGSSGTASVTYGRTLASNNVAFNNGGGGVHAYKADHVDLFHNTAYFNSASVELQYPQIDNNQGTDVRIWNNIGYAPTHTAGEPNEPVNGGAASIFRNNLWFGGDKAPTLGTGDVKADPQFVLASIDAAVADFRLKSTSPAINTGYTNALLSTRDLLSNARNGVADKGAYEYYAAAPTVVTAASATSVVNNASTLAVVFGDDEGPANLTYAWTTLAKPAGAADPAFGLSGVANADLTTATFAAAGTYTLRVTATDADGLSAASTVNVVVPDTTPPTFAGAVSRKVHGAAGTFDLALNTSGTATIEPRLGGGSTIVLTFAEPVVAADGTLDASEFGLTNAAFVSASVSGNAVTLNLTTTNARYTTVTLAGLTDAAGNPLAGDNDLTFGNNFGDVNRTGGVSVSDQQAVKNALLATLDASSFLCDVNLSGTVSVSDQQAVKNYLLTTIS